MSEGTKHAILHYLDEPVRILYWTKEGLGFYFGLPFMGMMFEQEVLGGVLTVLGGFLHRTYKKRFGNINLSIFRYWYFPPNNRFRCLPPSYIKCYIG